MKDWQTILAPPEGTEAPLRCFYLLRKRGQSLLYVPKDPKLADATLRLYPAQTLRARTFLRILSLSFRARLPALNERITIPVSSQTPFGSFLKQLIPGSEGVPEFGVLGGNAKTPGRRYTLLLFDASGQPRVVVKVGISPKARELIQAEQDFFFPHRPQFMGLPEALEKYEGEDAKAIAYRYVEGTSPTLERQDGIEKLLKSWISEGDPVPLSALPVWAEVEALRQDHPGLEPIFQILRETRVLPVLYHGDFASWNIRKYSPVQEDDVVVLDWERNRREGIPAWDWFHYIIQYDMLVLRAPPERTLADLEALWKRPAFLEYAQRTGIEKIVKELTLIHFLYLLRYFAPRDNTRAVHLLVEKFRETYFPDFALPGAPLKISVITPSYRQLAWLKLCVASVEDQQGVTVEHIIQDAQSGPGLDTWVRSHSKAHLYTEADFGMYDAINRGFARATGDIVCWLNSDEQYLEGALAKVAHYFEAHPEVDVLFGDAVLIGNTGTLLSYRRAIFPDQMHVQLSHLNVLSCATFVRRSVLERGYILDIRWKAIADAVWIVDLLRAGIPMAVLNEPLAVFTITDKNLGQTSLALTEAEHWQMETAPRMRWLRPFFVWRHRFNKLIHGAYWPRSIDLEVYTLANPDERSKRGANFLGFKWPHST